MTVKELSNVFEGYDYLTIKNIDGKVVVWSDDPGYEGMPEDNPYENYKALTASVVSEVFTTLLVTVDVKYRVNPIYVLTNEEEDIILITSSKIRAIYKGIQTLKEMYGYEYGYEDRGEMIEEFLDDPENSYPIKMKTRSIEDDREWYFPTDEDEQEMNWWYKQFKENKGNWEC